MNIVAFSTSRAGDWRWRIVNLRGDVVEESSTRFPTIAAAVAAGEHRAHQRVAAEPPLVRSSPRRPR